MNILSKFLRALGIVTEGSLPESDFVERTFSLQRIWDEVNNLLVNVDMDRGTFSWPLDLYVDSNNRMFVIVAQDGKLYRVGVNTHELNDEMVVTFGDWYELPLEAQGDGERIAATPSTPATMAMVDDPVVELVGESAEEIVSSTSTTGATITITVTPRSGVTIVRQNNGEVRWFARAATAVLNRVGEIDSTMLFDSFIEHAERNGEYPEFQFFHLGESFGIGQADWVAREGAVYLVTGLFYDTVLAKAAVAALEQDNDNFWGISIGYEPLEKPQMLRIAGEVEIPVYEKGRNVELSLLPEKMAAALFTCVHLQDEGVIRMNDKTRDALLKLFGGDEASMNAFLSTVDDVNRTITDRKLVFRDNDESTEQPAVEETSTPEPVQSQVAEITLDDAAIDAIVARINASEMFANISRSVQEVAPMRETLTALDGRLGELEARVAALSQTDSDKQRQWLNDLPQNATRIAATYRPRQDAMDTNAEPAKAPRANAERALAGLPAYKSTNGK